MEKYNKENFDLETGQPLYHPKINTNYVVKSVKKCHKSSKSIGNLFHNQKSEEILEKMKERRFGDLFRLLDSNADGLISAQRIDISKLHPAVVQILTPLFSEMEEMAQTLD